MDRVPWMGRTLPAMGNLLLSLYFYFYAIKDAVLAAIACEPAAPILGRFIVNFVAALALFDFLIIILITFWVKSRLHALT